MNASSVSLIDSSAWIEVLRGTATVSLREKVTQALESKIAAISEPIWLELSRGIRGKKEAAHLDSLRILCVWLPFTSDCWEKANVIAKTCTAAGINLPLGDILVAACARTHQVDLIENDRHFAMIDKAMK
jgi:predicted nucleic acid-binding protein